MLNLNKLKRRTLRTQRTAINIPKSSWQENGED